MSKSIGIVTFQWADNYGGLLQCYALKEFINRMGQNAKIINYWPQYAIENHCSRIGLISTFKEFKKLVMPNWRYMAKNFILGRSYSTRKGSIRMDRFRNKYLLDDQVIFYSYSEIESEIKKYDIIISGSDQIWNPNLTGKQFDNVYFLNFQSSILKKVAYAASLGVTLKDEWKQRFFQLVSQYDYVSTRESSLSSLLCRELGIESRAVVDPVFLLDEKTWGEMIPERMDDSHYILLYVLQRDSNIVSIANWLTEQTQLPIRVFGAKRKYRNAKYVPEGDILEFLFQFKNADYILTNSFHGTAFSLIFRRRFLSFLDSQKPTRIKDLLTDVGLNERIFNGHNYSIVLEEPNYEKAMKLLDEKVHQSKDFLYSCIS